jgi:hypothetical protein
MTVAKMICQRRAGRSAGSAAISSTCINKRRHHRMCGAFDPEAPQRRLWSGQMRHHCGYSIAVILIHVPSSLCVAPIVAQVYEGVNQITLSLQKSEGGRGRTK